MITTNIRKASDECQALHDISVRKTLTEAINKAVDHKINIDSSKEEKEASLTAIRFNEGKIRWDLIDPTAIEGVALVLGFGVEKYAAENWRKGLSWKATLRSLESHLQALKRGEDIDSESGLPHIDHLGCNWMFFSNYQKLGIGVDDRIKLVKNTPSITEKVDALLAARHKDWGVQGIVP